MDDSYCNGVAGLETADSAAEAGEGLWRRPESVWMEYVFEWNPLLAGRLIL